MVQKSSIWDAAAAAPASVAFAALAVMIASPAAFADSTPTTATTTDGSATSVANVATPSTARNLLNKLDVTFLSTYYGPSTGKVTNPIQPDEYGQTPQGGDAMFFDNSLPILYKLNDQGMVAGIGINAAYTPVYGKGFELEDPYVKIGNKKLIKAGNFNLSADIRDYLPVTSKSHNAGRLFKFRSVQFATYEIPNSKWSFNSISSVYYHIYNGDQTPSAKQFVAYINPNVNYQAFSQLGIWAGYEMDGSQTVSQNFFEWNNDGTFLYLGLSWDPTKKLNISPLLQFRPGGAVNADSTSIQALLSYKVL